MCEITKFLREISKKPVDKHFLSIYVNSKGNAKLGDALVNLIYSIAKTLVTTSPTGVKVSDSILAEAYRESLWFKSDTLAIKGNKGRVADAVEALILYFWIHEKVSITDLVIPIKEKLDEKYLHHPREEHKTASKSFKNLLNSLYHRYQKNESSKDLPENH
ncbi:MAG: ribonuclease III family protein [Candidatus Hodarchaeales archaeon]